MNNKLKRYVGLDLLRAFLMLIGPAFHIGLIFNTPEIITQTDTNTPIVTSILSITHPFRMELFFLLSGFFSAYLIENKSLSFFWTNRKIKIFYPLVTSLAIILPCTAFTYSLILDTPIPVTFFHIWFMITLSAISVIYYYFYKQIKKVIFYIIKFPSLVIITSSLLFLFIFLKIHDKVILFHGIYDEPIRFFILLSIPINLIISILGSSLFYKSHIVSKLTGILSFVCFLYLHSIYKSDYFAGIQPLIRKFIIIFYAYSTAYLILFIFNYFKNLEIKQSYIISFLVNSSLTVYLVHQPLVYLNTYIFDNVALDTYNFFLILILSTYIQSFICYILLSQYKLTRILFGIKEKVSLNFNRAIKENEKNRITI